MDVLRRYGERFITGRVEKGKQLGRTIGFPTANLQMVDNFAFDQGVYGAYVYYESQTFLGIMNIGTRPTFDDGHHQTCEVHLLNFNKEIYGKQLIIETMFYIRSEKKFDQLQDLTDQLQADAFYARKQFRRFE